MKTKNLILLFALLALVASLISLQAQTTLLFEGFEGAFPEANGWSVGDANPAGPFAYWDDVDLNFGGAGAHTGNWKAHCAGFGYGGSPAAPTYQNEMRAFMEKSIDLTGFTTATLRFWHKLPSVESCCDIPSVWVGGTRVWFDSNPTTAWTETTVDLTALVGGLRALRFEFSSDGTVTAEGWYLDDILVTGITTPVNDLCIRSIALTSGVPHTMDTATATAELFTPTCQPNFGKGVWFTFTPPASAFVELSTCGSSFDSVLQVYAGGESSCEFMTPVACNDDNGPLCAGNNASLQFSVAANTRLRVLAGGYNSQGGTLVITARWEDTIPPFIICPNNITVQCETDAPPRPTSLAQFLAQGGQAGDNWDTNLNYSSGDSPLMNGPCGGIIRRTHTVIDDWTNSASCVQVITVCDTIPPTIACPPNIVTNTDPGQCSRSNVALTLTAYDNCGVASLITSPGIDAPGWTYPIGVTLVTVTAWDWAGNSNTCRFTVTVLDTELPYIYCPAAFFTFTEPGACEKTNVIYPVFANDNCPGAVVWCDPPSGSTFPRGTSLVRCMGRDAAGNTNSCAFPVTIQGFEPFCTSLGSLPPGAILSGQAYLNTNDGSLHLTDAVNSQQGTFLLPASWPLGSFRASFKALVGDSTSADPADGFSFCFGTDLSASFGEEGSGTGLIVSFDTFNNAGEEAPSIDLKWNGTTFAHAPKRIITGTPAAFVDVFIELTPAGQVTVIYSGDTVHDAVSIPGYTPILGNSTFGFGARTGSLNAKHWIDDFCVKDDAPCAPPRLTITHSNAIVVVSWPRPAEDWMLEWTNVLPKVASPWPRIPPPYQTNGPRFQFMEPAPTGHKFYRLHRP